MKRNTKKKVVKPDPHSHLYLGETDPAEYIHSNKTHRSVSEAFKDADYATAWYRPKSEWEDCKEFIGGMVLIAPALLFVVYVCYLILKGI
jgi:hypothetical protein